MTIWPRLTSLHSIYFVNLLSAFRSSDPMTAEISKEDEGMLQSAPCSKLPPSRTYRNLVKIMSDRYPNLQFLSTLLNESRPENSRRGLAAALELFEDSIHQHLFNSSNQLSAYMKNSFNSKVKNSKGTTVPRRTAPSTS